MVKEVKDYIEKIQERYPFLTQSEISKIISYGLQKYAWVNKRHADVAIYYRKDPMIIHCGPLGSNALIHYYRFLQKNRMKERCLFYLKKQEWDGYYYIGLREEEQKELTKRGRNVHFKNVYLTKLKKELYHIPSVKHIWRVPSKGDLGWRFFREEYITDQAQYIGKNHYEKYHQCFLGRFKEGSTSSSNETTDIH